MYKQMMMVSLIAAGGLSGCISGDRIDQKWDDWVSENSSCEVDDDCALVYPGCPLGCFTAVSADAVEDAEAKADDLIRRYELGGRSCDYDCMHAGEPICDAGTCAVGEWDSGL